MQITISTNSALPNWLAYTSFFALIISCISAAMAFYSVKAARRSARANAEQTILNYKNIINEGFARYKVKGPFAEILKIPEENLESYIPKTALFFFQINLLEYVYRHQDLLRDSDDISSYASWAKYVLGPWIKRDQELAQNFVLLCNTKDNLNDEFIVWIKSLIEVSE